MFLDGAYNRTKFGLVKPYTRAYNSTIYIRFHNAKKMSEKKASVQVIDRAGKLLDSIGNQVEDSVSLKILSAETGLHPSTAFRILSSLISIGFVRRNEAGRYSLGIKLRQLGCRVRGSADITTEAKSIMEWLRDTVGETVNLTIREGDEVVYIERATTTRIMRVEQVVGSRIPLHVTAVGKLMLGEGNDDVIKEYVKRTGLPKYTQHTFTKLASLKREIESSKARGYALDNEEAELGVGCIGVLVRDARGNAVAGLSISAPMERRKEEWISLVQEAGRRLSERLGYNFNQ
jgi:IclR family acetate operon transcriptional repressor